MTNFGGFNMEYAVENKFKTEDERARQVKIQQIAEEIIKESIKERESN
jgi:hypothetical protein